MGTGVRVAVIYVDMVWFMSILGETDMNRNATSELLTIAALLVLLGRKSRQYIYDLMNRDATFPKPVRTPGGQILWRRREVVAWIEALPRAEFVGLDAVTRRTMLQPAAA